MKTHKNTNTATTFEMRILLYIASFLVLIVGISLYFLTEHTDEYFSWTINPPLTAAFLGVGYLASFLLEFLSARESLWARSRLAVPAVFAFTTLTMIVTFIHWDRFHFDAERWFTVAGTWVWVAVYVSVPIMMSIVWFRQNRTGGSDPERTQPVPEWVRILMGLQGSVMIVLGVVMLIVPDMIFGVWPWQLSQLTARAIGAWLVGLGIAAAHAAVENDLPRLKSVLVSYAAYAILQLIALLRYTNDVDWDRLSAPIYVTFLLSLLAVGLYGVTNSYDMLLKPKES